MLKKFGFVTVAVAAGAFMAGGIASAGTPAEEHDGGYDHTGQVSLVNLNDTDVLHNVNATVGFCDNNVNVLGVQVPVRDSLNGIGVPILSPGAHEAEGDSPFNCAGSGVADGGTSQGN
jgi:hypothetical protein